MNLWEYIADRVVVDGNGCWVWQKSLTAHGYGHFGLSGKTFAAHRVSYEQFIGPIPSGMHLRHSCDRRSCCNPLHLFPGTNRENRADSVNKLRHARGERHGMRKLSETDVREIRGLIGSMTGRAIAAKFGITPQQVTKIKRGQRWAESIT